jgi:hypothetical protein
VDGAGGAPPNVGAPPTSDPVTPACRLRRAWRRLSTRQTTSVTVATTRHARQVPRPEPPACLPPAGRTPAPTRADTAPEACVLLRACHAAAAPPGSAAAATAAAAHSHGAAASASRPREPRAPGHHPMDACHHPPAAGGLGRGARAGGVCAPAQAGAGRAGGWRTPAGPEPPSKRRLRTAAGASQRTPGPRARPSRRRSPAAADHVRACPLPPCVRALTTPWKSTVPANPTRTSRSAGCTMYDLRSLI